jgi:NTP pyrophosphatase (non-canonical NTP hydrolase)
MGRKPLIETAALEAALQRFADERDWQRFHTPRNLMLALTGEVGELAEIFQWLTDEEVAQLADDPARFTHLQEEVADVLLYLVRLASVMKLDINAAVRDKLQKNARKYPAPVRMHSGLMSGKLAAADFCCGSAWPKLGGNKSRCRRQQCSRKWRTGRCHPAGRAYRGIEWCRHEHRVGHSGLPLGQRLVAAGHAAGGAGVHRLLPCRPEAFWHSFKQLFHTKLLGNYQPNAGHQFLAWLEEAGKQVSILTQNIDGLHGVAGSRHVSELHGTLRTASCPSCGRRRGWNTSITMCCRCVPTAWMCSSRTWCCMASRYR